MMTPDDALAAQMLAERRLMLAGPLDPSSVGAAVAQLMLFDGQSSDPVSVIVNSPGGVLEDALGLVDTVQLMRTPLTVDVLGQAHGSAGIFVAAAPGTRRLGATASISLRLGAAASADPAQRTAEELARMVEASDDLRRRLAALIGTRAGQTIEWVLDQFERGNTWFGADAAEAGLVDRLR